MDLNISNYFKLNDLTTEDRNAFVNAIIDLVLAKIAHDIGDHLTESELEELEKISANGDSRAVLAWLNKNVPNFSQGVDEALAEIAADLHNKVDAILAAIKLDEEK